MRPLAEKMLGQDCRFVTGNYVFVVPNDDRAGGWGLHRDLPFENSLCSDGMPRIMSFWLALTEAGPRNSCLYCLPASRDPNYPNNLAAHSIPHVEDVECMPAGPGQVIGLNHALLHWGSRSSSRGNGRRISVVFDLQRADVQPYHCAWMDLSGPSGFEQRAAFVAHVVLWLKKYNVQFSESDIQLAKDLLTRYRHRIQLSASFDADFWPED
ncbi:phytanoyl-CoA dioxygenase family protein [Rubrivivax gelatinosus]|uniref:phytanoyl-CoA dioxygenase family protein n=1 Tax=Rubrivivax gelatinosus TaxID=28068 RepID=UPI002175656E|nr:phytanoyl-CoA dioxygenase family protein [Rubrivivax gelatinosus]